MDIEESKQEQNQQSSQQDEHILQIINEEMLDEKFLGTAAQVRQIFQNVLKIEPNFVKQLKDRLSNKQIYFVRHAEAYHNQWNKKSLLNYLGINKYQNILENYDPKLTEKGVHQAKSLEKQLCSTRYKDLQFEIVYISPMSRTIQTYENIKKGYPLCKITKNECFATQLIREKFKKPSHIGTSINILEQRYPDINFDMIKVRKWWNHWAQDQKKEIQQINEQQDHILQQELIQESEQDLLARLAYFIVLVSLKPQNVILLVSHSKIYKAFSGFPFFQWASNAEFLILKNDELVKIVRKYI